MLKRIYLQCITAAVVVFIFANGVAYSAQDIATANAVEVEAVEAMKPGGDKNFSGETPLGDLSENDQEDDLLSEESSEESADESASVSGEESGASGSSGSFGSFVSSSSSSAVSSSSVSTSSQKPSEPPASNVSSSKSSSSGMQPPTSNSYVTPPESTGGSKPAASVSSASSKPTTSSSKPTTSSSKPASSSSSKPASSSSSKPASSTPNSVPPSSGETVRISVSGETKELEAFNAVCRVVEGEMGSSFHVEALKAQALAAYSYLKEQNGKGVTPILPMREPSQKVINAVAAVWGEAIYSGNSFAFTPYHASSAGYTNPSADVWGGSYQYLTAVASAYDPSSNNKNVTAVIPAGTLQSGLENVLGITLDENAPESWMEIVSTNGGGYVLSVRVTDASGGSHMTTGRKIRESVLGYKLKSHAFTFSYANEDFTFVTNGYGHGVGMSQTGANGYAINDGWNYRDILSHYYPGTSVH